MLPQLFSDPLWLINSSMTTLPYFGTHNFVIFSHAFLQNILLLKKEEYRARSWVAVWDCYCWTMPRALERNYFLFAILPNLSGMVTYDIVPPILMLFIYFNLNLDMTRMAVVKNNWVPSELHKFQNFKFSNFQILTLLTGQ